VYNLLNFFWLHYGTTIALFHSASVDPMQENVS
jgi:hypothetical protein